MMKNLFLSAGLAAALVCAAPAAWAQGKDSGDQKFMKEAIEANLAEIEVGKLAQQKGTSDGVRQFGKTLEQDHSAANQKAMSLANEMGVTPPTEPNKKQKAIYDKLSKLSGDKFDKQFVKDMVADHKKDIKEFQKEAKKSGDKAAGFANETLPVLQKHLDMAQQLEGKAGTTGSR